MPGYPKSGVVATPGEGSRKCGDFASTWAHKPSAVLQERKPGYKSVARKCGQNVCQRVWESAQLTNHQNLAIQVVMKEEPPTYQDVQGQLGCPGPAESEPVERHYTYRGMGECAVHHLNTSDASCPAEQSATFREPGRGVVWPAGEARGCGIVCPLSPLTPGQTHMKYISVRGCSTCKYND